jgi:hypothetical protein
VIRLGEAGELRERFFAISVERRLTHPAARAVSEGARAGLFAGDAVDGGGHADNGQPVEQVAAQQGAQPNVVVAARQPHP